MRGWVMTKGEQSILAHTFAGRIKTVRDDLLEFGLSTHRQLEGGTVHREFFHPWATEARIIYHLIRDGMMIGGKVLLGLGITIKGLKALQQTPTWQDIQDEFSQADIDCAERALHACLPFTNVAE